MAFAALQIRPGEDNHAVIQRFFEVASGMGLGFKLLEPFGTFTLGQTSLLRFRTDCADLDSLIPFFQDENRAFIIPGKSGYRFITQTTEGKAPIATMQNSKMPGYHRKYHGTANKFWDRQFS